MNKTKVLLTVAFLMILVAIFNRKIFGSERLSTVDYAFILGALVTWGLYLQNMEVPEMFKSQRDFKKNMTFQTLSNQSFRGQDLRNVDFSDSILIKADFAHADLTGSRFNNSDLTDANFLGSKGAIWSNARFCNTVMPDGSIRSDGC